MHKSGYKRGGRKIDYNGKEQGDNYVIAQISSAGFGSSCNGIVQLLLEFGLHNVFTN